MHEFISTDSNCSLKFDKMLPLFIGKITVYIVVLTYPSASVIRDVAYGLVDSSEIYVKHGARRSEVSMYGRWGISFGLKVIAVVLNMALTVFECSGVKSFSTKLYKAFRISDVLLAR
jgi:hypothetical protein